MRKMPLTNLFSQGNNTDTNYIDFSDTDPFFPSGFCGKEVDETDEFTRY